MVWQAGRGARSAAPDSGRKSYRRVAPLATVTSLAPSIPRHGAACLVHEWRRLQKPPDNPPLRQTFCCQADCSTRGSRNNPRTATTPSDKKLRTDAPGCLAARELVMDRVFEAALGLSALHNEVQQKSARALARPGGRAGALQNKLPASRIRRQMCLGRGQPHAARAAEVARLGGSGRRYAETDVGRMQARARAWALGDGTPCARRRDEAADWRACADGGRQLRTRAQPHRALLPQAKRTRLTSAS